MIINTLGELKPFGHLDFGSVFRFLSEYFIKIEPVDGKSAVNLCSGSAMRIEYATLVHPVNCELVIK